MSAGLHTPHFTARMVADGVQAIHGPANDLMYLVTGSRRAMLVDTGMGIGDLAAQVSRLTALPLIVVNTHGHPDHGGGNCNFEQVWAPPKDETIRQAMCTVAYRAADIRAILGTSHPDTPRLVEALVPSRPLEMLPLSPGQVLDLGDRQFEVIETPGHTPGSICLLDPRHKMLFTGDTVVSTPVWMYLEHSLPLSTYHRSLLALRDRAGEFEILFPGHQPTPASKDLLHDLIACSGEILLGNNPGEPIRTFAGEGRLWKHGQAQVVSNPHTLQDVAVDSC